MIFGDNARLPDRIWSKIGRAANGCWVWLRYKGWYGYGRVHWRGKAKDIHRVVYEVFRGAVPRGLELDHLCRNPACCNPAHLEAVTHRENCRRGDVGKHCSDRTHCPAGHEYNDANTRIYRNMRYCKMCITDRRVST